MNLEIIHRGQGFSRPIALVKEKIEKNKGFLDMDPMRTIFKSDIEAKFEFKKDSLRWAYFMYNDFTDAMDMQAEGVLKSNWEGTSPNLRHTVTSKPCKIFGLKASQYPKLIKGAKKFLKTKGYDIYDKSEVKVLEGIRFLVEFEEKDGEPGKVLAQLFYINSADKRVRTPFIEGEF